MITLQYRAALAANGLRAFQGNVAAVQPGKLSDLMLHEHDASGLCNELPARVEQLRLHHGCKLKE